MSMINAQVKKLREYAAYIGNCAGVPFETIKILKDAAAAIDSLSAKLAYYEDLEVQGKLLKLPCAVGDTVYRIHKATESSPDEVYKCRVTGVKQEYNSTSIRLYANINKENYSIWIDNWFDKCQMGYEFFLTEQEAEQALRKAKEETND